MVERLNLPYTTQDLFPHSASPRADLQSITALDHGRPSLTATLSYYVPARSRAPIHRRQRLLWHFARIRALIRRVCKPSTMDFETAMWDIIHLLVNPRKMYRSHYFYRQLSLSVNRLSYSRDDPSFLLLLTALLSLSAVAWGLVYSPHTRDILKLVVYMVLIDFYLTGLVIATVSWYLTNRLFNEHFEIGGENNRSSVAYVEWEFCFDVHCNAFLVIWCMLYVVQLVLMPLIKMKSSIVALLLGNTLYFGSLGYYLVITFFGFSYLPVITNLKPNSASQTNAAKKLQMILLVIILPILFVCWLLTVLLGLNVAQIMVHAYFHTVF